MEIHGIIWNIRIVEKIIDKHDLYPQEVEEVFQNRYALRSVSDIYHLLGRTNAGAYVFVVFRKQYDCIKVITARPMTDAEKRLYRRQ